MSSPKPTLDDLRIERSAEPESTSRFWPVAIGIVVLVLAVGVVLWLKRPGGIPVRTVLVREATGNGIERTVLNASGYVTARAAGDRFLQGHRQGDRSARRGGDESAGRAGPRAPRRYEREDEPASWLKPSWCPRRTRWPRRACASGRRTRNWSARRGLVKSKIATQADYDHAEAAALALKARLEQQQADVTVAAKAGGLLGAAVGRHHHPRAVLRHCHLEERAAGRDDLADLRRGRLHPHGHLHHRGHGIPGDRD